MLLKTERDYIVVKIDLWQLYFFVYLSPKLRADGVPWEAWIFLPLWILNNIFIELHLVLQGDQELAG